MVKEDIPKMLEDFKSRNKRIINKEVLVNSTVTIQLIWNFRTGIHNMQH